MDAITGSWIVFLVYSVLVVGAGYLARRMERHRAAGHENLEFWMAGRALPGWRLGISLTSGWLMLGWIGFGMSQIYSYGATGLWLLQIPWFLLCILVVLLVPYYRRVAAVSLPQALGRRFGPALRYLSAAFSVLVFLSWTGAELVMVRTLAGPRLGLEDQPLPLLGLFVLPILLYTVLGGFRAIVMTDLIQFAIMALFMIVLCVWAWARASEAAPAGLLEALRAAAPPGAGEGAALRLDFLGWVFPVALLLGYLPGWLIEQDLTLRIQAAPTTREARRGALLGLVLISTFVIALPALVAFFALVVFKPGTPGAEAIGADYTGIILAFIQQMPALLALFMFLGLVACQMSTVDTFANVTAMPLAYDLVGPLALKGASPRLIGLAARALSGAALLLGLAYALAAGSLGDVYYLSSGLLSAAIAVPALAVFWRRATTPGVVAGSLAGAGATLAMYFYEYHGLQMADHEASGYYANVLPGWLAGACGYLYIGTGVLAAAATLVAVSLLTPRSAPGLLAAVDPVPAEGPAALDALSCQ